MIHTTGALQARSLVAVNYTATASGSAFGARHPVTPVGILCLRSFVTGAGSSDLRKLIEKHEGIPHPQANSHLKWQRDTIQTMIGDIRVRFERHVATSVPLESEWMKILTGMTYAEFGSKDSIAIDVGHPVSFPSNCSLNFFPP